MAWLSWRYFCGSLANICLISLVSFVSPSYSNDPVGDFIPFEAIGDSYGAVQTHRTENIEEDSGTNSAYGRLPGIQHEFRFEVGPGNEQCLFQYLRKGSQFHFTYQVIRGADSSFKVAVRDPSGSSMEYLRWLTEGEIDTHLNETGVYSFCFDNSISMFSSKLVYFYILSYIDEDWRSYAGEIEEFHIEVENFTKALEMVDQYTHKVKVFQAVSRGQAITDWYTISENNSIVHTMSILMCVVIVLTSGFQVFFVRRLFNVHGSGVQSVSKPRA